MQNGPDASWLAPYAASGRCEGLPLQMSPENRTHPEKKFYHSSCIPERNEKDKKDASIAPQPVGAEMGSTSARDRFDEWVAVRCVCINCEVMRTEIYRFLLWFIATGWDGTEIISY